MVRLLTGFFSILGPFGTLAAQEAAEVDAAVVRLAPGIPLAEYADRRARLLAALPDGITLLQARPSEKAMEQWGFVQEPSFQYFTGLNEVTGAVLALDGHTGGSVLFVPPPPSSFGFEVSGVAPPPGERTADRIGVSEVLPWSRFLAWMRGRINVGASTIYLNEARRPEGSGVPPGMRPVAGSHELWRTAVSEAFPDSEIRSAKASIDRLRWSKSPAEVALLRTNAERTVEALKSVAAQMGPGMRQRELELTVVAACIRSGGEGPSFWPWTMAGPNARLDRLLQAFFRYGHLDRALRDGELVRVDIGCAGGAYGADVGRTLPVSGEFTPGQSEAWDLLVTGYLAGIDAMAPGVSIEEVRRAAIDAVRRAAPAMRTGAGREAARVILAGGEAIWHFHGVGIESGEASLATLRAGSVIALEPMIEVFGDAFYLEDMIYVTADGPRLLSRGLPHRAREIERLMSG